MRKTLALLFVLSLLILHIFPSAAIAEGNYGANTSSDSYTSDINPFHKHGYDGECTWYAWGRAREKCGIALSWNGGEYLGNARNWYANASAAGYSVGSTARANSIGVSNSGPYGHVFFVESVAGNTIYCSEYNWPCDANGNYNANGPYSDHKYHETTRNASSITQYIYLEATSSTLDVNTILDGVDTGAGTVKDGVRYGTFDVYLNGSLFVDDADDIIPTECTSYEIKDIKVTDGHEYVGAEGNITRNLSSGQAITVKLKFNTVNASSYVSSHSPAAISVYNNHSYFFYDAPVTWYAADIISKHLGGHLVTITSAAENTFVKSMIGDSACWIGATDKDSEGAWKWVSGESFSYSNWSSDQPDNHSGNDEGAENYAHIWANGSQWNDGSGYTPFPFICEIDRAYTIKYDVNGGAGSIPQQNKAAGQTIKLSTTIPTRSGYTFKGWGTSATATAAAYQPGGSYGQDKDLTLYAVWESLTYTISYDANGGTNAPDSQTVEGGGSVTLATGVPTWTGHDFLGWSTSQTATAAEYQPGGIYPGGNATLYAVWEIQRFTVSFDSDGAGSYDPIIVSYGETVSVLPTPEKHGFFFRGWFDLSGQKVTESTVVKTDLLLTARWSEPTKLSIPSATTRIEDEAFDGIAANVVYIPAGVTYIGSQAFANNDSLYSVVVYSRTVSPVSDAFANCPNMTIYGYQDTPIHYFAVAKNIPFKPIATSDWVLESEVPIGAKLTGEEKWTYDKIIIETTTSTETSLEGWTRDASNSRWEQSETGTNQYVNFPGGFSTGHALYSKYNTKLTNSETETLKTVVGNDETIAGYIYYHWTLDGEWPGKAAEAGKAINVFVESAGGPNPDGYTYTLFHAFEVNSILEPTSGTGTNGELNLVGEGIYSTCHHSVYNLSQYVSHWWYITEIRQQTFTKYQRIFTYTRETTEPHESTENVVAGYGITNVRHYVKYGF